MEPPVRSRYHLQKPSVYNVDYSFELIPDPNKIDRAKDLKLWLPIPREWDSQKAVKIISVEPEPHAKYEDPEYGNPMLFWDFGKEPEKPSYKVDIKFRLETYEIHAEVDPEQVGLYDKTSKEYALYTRSARTICITPKIKQMAQEAVGDETNPYLQAKRIGEFVMRKVHYKILDFERGRGIKCLLDFPVIDEKTGEEYYEGCCSQKVALIVALCRAVGIPARSVGGYVGWCPWIKAEDLKPRFKLGRKLSPDGLAASRHYTSLTPHTWGEFYIPNYGWIPIYDCEVGHWDNRRWITAKGCDVNIGPHCPKNDSQGYGVLHVLLHKGKADGLSRPVWNIAKIRTANVKVLHRSDPFPADALAEYAAWLYPEAEAERKLESWRKYVSGWIGYKTRGRPEKNAALAEAYENNPRARYSCEAFVCHMLRRIVGDKIFFDIFKRYENLRLRSGQPVSTAHFQKIAEDTYGKPLGWFFNQWTKATELSEFKLDKVRITRDEKGWQVRGHLLQVGGAFFRVPVELALETEKGVEHHEIRQEKRNVDFGFRTLNKPKKLVVDPDNEILKIQRTPPHIYRFWDSYPNQIIIYGTTAEAEGNKTAAEHFKDYYFRRLGNEIIKADADVNQADLKTKCVVLFGRPETNRITQELKDIFPIKFDKNKFIWQRATYDKPTQGVIQIVEQALYPNGPKRLVILCAGLSSKATEQICDLQDLYVYLYDLPWWLVTYDAMASYIIFDRDKVLISGDWEDADSNLYWNFDTHPSIQLGPNEK